MKNNNQNSLPATRNWTSSSIKRRLPTRTNNTTIPFQPSRERVRPPGSCAQLLLAFYSLINAVLAPPMLDSIITFTTTAQDQPCAPRGVQLYLVSYNNFGLKQSPSLSCRIVVFSASSLPLPSAPQAYPFATHSRSPCMAFANTPSPRSYPSFQCAHVQALTSNHLRSSAGAMTMAHQPCQTRARSQRHQQQQDEKRWALSLQLAGRLPCLPGFALAGMDLVPC